MSASEKEGTDGEVCESCRAAVAGGKAGCLKLFEEVIAREFGDYRYGRVHRLTVDAYSLQHPDVYMRSGKSFAAHLTGMCAALESRDAQEAQDVNRTVQKWLSTNPKIGKPDIPERRGRLTVAHVHAAADADEHVGRVREWARDVWDAWAEHRELARRLIAEAAAHVSKV